MERMIEQAPSVPNKAQVTASEKSCLSRPLSLLLNDSDSPKEKKITQRQLINLLNGLHFKDRTIRAVFRHKNYPKDLILDLQSLPCRDARLTCRWRQVVDPKHLSELYSFLYLRIPKEQIFIEVLPDIEALHEDYITFLLPEQCIEISSCKPIRQKCKDVNVLMLQHGARYSGKLIDCSPSQFNVSVNTAPPQHFHWVQEKRPVTIVLSEDQQTLYSGQCRIIQHNGHLQNRHFILEPIDQKIHRFAPKEIRSARYQLPLPPDVYFVHPLLGKAAYLKVRDLCGTGFSVEEELSRAALLPGLIIPDLLLRFSDGKTFRCLAQVIYCNVVQEDQTPIVRCGLTILNMPIQDHVRLIGLIQQTVDSHTYVSGKVDMDELWSFFFETGFIYPEKYSLIHANKEKIKNTYDILYNSAPSVSVHFIYRRNSRILAHAAALHLYEYAWLVHHHAAIRRSDNRGGLIIASQAVNFLNEANRNSAMKMDYILCYFRPENRFPSHVFGGVARSINDPAICSLDTFAYFYYRTKERGEQQWTDNWQLSPIGDEDLDELRTFYENQSGGLMLHGLHLTPDRLDCSQLAQAYRRIGLKRDRHVFSLRHKGILCAIAMVNISDTGLNLSDLTNAITVIVINHSSLTGSIFDALIQKLSVYYEHFKIPILLYPKQTASELGIPYEKDYTLWVYNTHRPEPCVKYMKRLLRFCQND